MSFRLPKVYGQARPVGYNDRKLSTKEKNFAAELMHQQCWCWGQDIVSAENLLIRFGFARHRASVCPGATRYEIERDDARVALWGFGMWIRLPSGAQGFFARYRRGAWLLPESFDVGDVHNDAQVEPHLRRPTLGRDYAVALELASAAATWCEQYERWIVESESADHRRRTLEKWEHPIVASHEMVAAWRRVRTIYRQWYRRGSNVNALEGMLCSPMRS